MVVERNPVDRRLDRRVQQLHHQHEQRRHDELLAERVLVAHRGCEALERIARRAEDPSQPGLALVGAFGFHAARTVAETTETIPSSCAANLHGCRKPTRRASSTSCCVAPGCCLRAWARAASASSRTRSSAWAPARRCSSTRSCATRSRSTSSSARSTSWWAGSSRGASHYEVDSMARVASERLRQAVGALDELDTSLRGVLRSLISYMVEDPRTISSCLEDLFVAKSFERIGDHATNIFEHVIYAVHGENLRHAAPFSAQ